MKWGVDVDSPDSDGRTPLHWVSRRGGGAAHPARFGRARWGGRERAAGGRAPALAARCQLAARH